MSAERWFVRNGDEIWAAGDAALRYVAKAQSPHDAQLIAAAPALLDAVMALMDCPLRPAAWTLGHEAIAAAKYGATPEVPR